MRECTAYIPDTSCEDPKRARHRQRQARYEALQREQRSLSPGALRARRSRDLQRAGLTVFHVVGHKRRVAARRSGDAPSVSRQIYKFRRGVCKSAEIPLANQ
jgi:hypothetical protein